MQKLRNLLIGTIGFLTCFASGCAFVDQKIPLQYNVVVADTNAVNVGSIEIAKPIVPELEKKKGDLCIIGTVKNTYGMKTADAVTASSPSHWIASALKEELDAAGFQSSIVDNLSDTAERGIKTRIIKVWVDQDPGFWTVGALGQIQLRITLFRNGRKIKEFDVEGQGQADRSLIGDATTKREALRVTLEACMKKTIPIILDVYSKE